VDYSLRQRGRAAIEFLVDVRKQSNRLERRSDNYAERAGLFANDLPDDAEKLQQYVTPVLQGCPDFRVLRLMREWTLEQHGWIAMDAFEEIRADVEPALLALQTGHTQIRYAPDLKAPDYWQGYEFHRSAGGWDGHDFMGFVHGELCHRRMVDGSLADSILAVRAATAKLAPGKNPGKILELGCGSAQYTLELAEAYPDSEIWACDLSPRQLEEAQRRANERGLTWHLFAAAAENTGLEAEQFDLVTSYAVFHEIPSRSVKNVLAEAYRLLKPGGCILVGDVKPYHACDAYERWKTDFWNQLHGGDPFWREYGTTDLGLLAEQAGFSDAKWFGVGEHQYPFVLLAEK
jgi:SAM-dependent methyltransferase